MSVKDCNLKTRLDMEHGFMKIIIKNQVDRDNYDKEVKATPVDKSSRCVSRSRRPERDAYVPPMHRSNNTPKDQKDEDVSFHMDYEDQDGSLHRLTIHKNSDVRMLTKAFAATVGLTGAMEKALVVRMLEESKKRKATPDVFESSNI